MPGEARPRSCPGRCTPPDHAESLYRRHLELDQQRVDAHVGRVAADAGGQELTMMPRWPIAARFARHSNGAPCSTCSSDTEELSLACVCSTSSMEHDWASGNRRSSAGRSPSASLFRMPRDRLTDRRRTPRRHESALRACGSCHHPRSSGRMRRRARTRESTSTRCRPGPTQSPSEELLWCRTCQRTSSFRAEAVEVGGARAAKVLASHGGPAGGGRHCPAGSGPCTPGGPGSCHCSPGP